MAFMVNAAYQRREGALSHVAELKASCLSLYLSHRCWQFDETVPHDFIQCSSRSLSSLFCSVRAYLTAQSEREKRCRLQEVYDTFSEISLVNDVLRISGLACPLVASLGQKLPVANATFEKLRMFSDYRTPSVIRHFNNVFVILTPLLLVPSWAHLARQTPDPACVWLVYLAAFLTPLPFMALLRVQQLLENPFYGDSATNPDGIQVGALALVAYMADQDWMCDEGGGNEAAVPADVNGGGEPGVDVILT